MVGRNASAVFCHPTCMTMDPVVTNPEHYKVLFENDRVRVLEYTDQPGDAPTPHQHPDSVIHTMSSFRRRLVSGDVGREVELAAGSVNWRTCKGRTWRTRTAVVAKD